MLDRREIAVLVIALFFWLAGAIAASADVPMFFFVATLRIWYWWAIPAAIILEAIVFRFAFKTTWRIAFGISVAANLASGALGVPLYPVVGMMMYTVLAPLVTGMFGYGMVVEAAATLIALVMLDTAVELLALVLLYRVFHVPASILNALWVFCANFISTALLVTVIASVPNLPALDGQPEYLTQEQLDQVALQFSDELQQMKRMGAALFQGERIDKPELDPSWLAAQREEALLRNFRDLAIVISTGEDRENVEATFLIGEAHGRNLMAWQFGEQNDAYGCYELACFSRSEDENGSTIYYTAMGYSASGYSLSIIATLIERPTN
ncbi:hypothetical protein [Ruegeria profundi]|uniref:hypothetical protein n=1 Tax=Ruegeria profundi TaxID=1685378 RepID=UPI001CD4082E|nr:hypothetical protein [Ruegeria profundi]MCA0930389.1 hypothetical protein [Ruegeria profundi]